MQAIQWQLMGLNGDHRSVLTSPRQLCNTGMKHTITHNAGALDLVPSAPLTCDEAGLLVGEGRVHAVHAAPPARVANGRGGRCLGRSCVELPCTGTICRPSLCDVGAPDALVMY